MPPGLRCSRLRFRDVGSASLAAYATWLKLVLIDIRRIPVNDRRIVFAQADVPEYGPPKGTLLIAVGGWR